MMYEVPTPSMSNGRFYLHRSLLGLIQRLKDSSNRYIWQPGIEGGASGTIWGMPYSLTEVLPSINEIEDGDPFLIFGDLRNTILSVRVPMQTQFFNTGVITDASGNVLLNLMQQDAQAIRARVRMNQVHVHPEAYSVLVLGDIS
jgi:HK97 family phage major capsid protein